MELEKVHVFNNKIETGLRILVLLNAAHPKAFDIETLVYLDYLTIHSGDVSGGMPSLHVAVPSRNGEIFVRRKIIGEGLDIFIKQGLIDTVYVDDGVRYSATELSTPFLDSLTEEYTEGLRQRAEWVIDKFSEFTLSELSKKVPNIVANISVNKTHHE